MSKTANLGLELTTDENTTFESWRKAQNGEGDGSAAAPFSNAQLLDEFAGKIYGVSGIVTLTASEWTDGAYALNVAELGTDDAIFFSPVGAADKAAFETANVVASAEAGKVTFTARTAPTTDVALNYFIARGKANE